MIDNLSNFQRFAKLLYIALTYKIYIYKIYTYNDGVIRCCATCSPSFCIPYLYSLYIYIYKTESIFRYAHTKLSFPSIRRIIIYCRSFARIFFPRILSTGMMRNDPLFQIIHPYIIQAG